MWRGSRTRPTADASQTVKASRIRGGAVTGGELFYKSGGGGAPLMAVRVDAGPSGLEFGRPEPVFDSTTSGMIDSRHHYAVTGNGNSFLLRRPSLDPPPVTIIVNWTAELENQ